MGSQFFSDGQTETGGHVLNSETRLQAGTVVIYISSAVKMIPWDLTLLSSIPREVGDGNL